MGCTLTHSHTNWALGTGLVAVAGQLPPVFANRTTCDNACWALAVLLQQCSYCHLPQFADNCRCRCPSVTTPPLHDSHHQPGSVSSAGKAEEDHQEGRRVRRGECSAAKQHRAYQRWQTKGVDAASTAAACLAGLQSVGPAWLVCCCTPLCAPIPGVVRCPCAACLRSCAAWWRLPPRYFTAATPPADVLSNHLLPCPLQPCEAEHKPTKSKKEWHYYGEVCQCE